MVRRGVAIVKKKDSKWKDVWINSDGEETSPPSAEELKKKKCAALLSHGDFAQDNPLTHTAPKRKQSQKLSSEPRSERQASPNHEQSAARNEALTSLFSDLPDAPDTPTPSGGPVAPLTTVALPVSPLVGDQQANHGPLNQSIGAEQIARPTQQKALPKAHPALQPPAPSSSTPAPVNPVTESAETAETAESTDQNNEMASANNFIPMGQFRNMRACMVCAIIKTQQQFLNNGCPNCAFLELRGNQEGVQDCTSQVFEGLIAVSDSQKSWVARWQRLEGYVPGVYAVQVEGILPDDAITAAEENGVHYIPRDGSVNEALPTDA